VSNKFNMDEFIILLIVAFVIIGALMLIGTPLANWSEGNWSGTGGKFKVIASFDLGKVGVSESQVSRTIKFGSFTLGQTQTETLKEMSSLIVSRGYFGEDSKKFEINIGAHILNNLKDVKITFGIEETNLYGNLIVKWNDKVILDTLANLNRYELTIDRDNVKDTNTLEISAGTPGIYFWAATQYKLNNFKVIAEYGPEKFASFQIYPNEISAWDKGVLRFYTTTGQQGQISIKLNGVEIYSSSNPKHLVEEEYEFSEIGNAIKVGDNIMSFKATNVFEMDDVEFEIYVSSGSMVKERSFNISKEDMNLLSGNNKGIIEFNVDKIYREGVLTIKLNGKNLNVQTIREGKNTVNFDDSDVKEGINEITFSGTGGWEISGVKIGVA